MMEKYTMHSEREQKMIAAVLHAGAYVRGSHETDHKEKSNAKDFVTVADIKSQDMLRHELTAAFPTVAILSEEDDEAARQALYAVDFTGFVLDPIDGTYNFKRGMKESAVSVGFIQNGEPIAGAVYDPYRDELYTAEKGIGAFCNGEKISVSTQRQLDGASIATSNSYDSEAMARNLRRHMLIYERTGVMPWTSCPGSGILIMVWVACGRIDAYHHNGLKPWDNAAAFLIAREASAAVHALGEKKDAAFTSQTVVMGQPEIVEQLETIFTGHQELV